jgi:hypothetical protein
MSKKENDEKRMSVEFLRLMSLFTEYLDKSTLVTALVFLGMVVAGFSVIFFVAGLIDLLQTLMIGVYGGILIAYAALTYRRIIKKRFNKYLEAISHKTLMTDSEYRRYVENLDRILEKQYGKLIRAEEREEELKSLRNQIAHLQVENQNLVHKLRQLESEKGEG